MFKISFLPQWFRKASLQDPKALTQNQLLTQIDESSPLEVRHKQSSQKKPKFTLIELLVVIIILGILVAIWLPMTSCAPSPSQRGRSWINRLNQAQKEYSTQANHSRKFSSDLTVLGLDYQWLLKDKDYQYSLKVTPNSVFHYAKPKQQLFSNLPSYVGAVFVLPGIPNNSPYQIHTITCKTNGAVNPEKLSEPSLKGYFVDCGSGMSPAYRSQEIESDLQVTSRYLAALNVAQKEYYLKQEKFAQNLTDLGMALPNQSEDYQFTQEVTKTGVVYRAIARQANLYSYISGVVVYPNHSTKTSEITATICKSLVPGATTLTSPSLQDDQLNCPPSTKIITLPEE